MHHDEHEDSTTKMSKLNKIQDDSRKFDFTNIPLCGIDNAECTMTIFENGVLTTTTTELLKELALEASYKVASKDDASIFGGKSDMVYHVIFPSIMHASDDVPSSNFIDDQGDEMIEHGISHLTMMAFVDSLGELCHHIVSKSVFTRSPIYNVLPLFPCEESQNPDNLTEMSDSTI
ncbi:Tyrosyl-tRNA synthetase [Hordeum vulgare]|nr:Tyrosyl-tRNA synthetase [Hordeum vulgare]